MQPPAIWEIGFDANWLHSAQRVLERRFKKDGIFFWTLGAKINDPGVAGSPAQVLSIAPWLDD